MSDVIDLSGYIRQSGSGQGTAPPQPVSSWSSSHESLPVGGLNASALKKLNPDSELAKLLGLRVRLKHFNEEIIFSPTTL